jgi:cytochrome c oxidase subunit II
LPTEVAMTKARRAEGWARFPTMPHSLLIAAAGVAISLTACSGAPSTLEPRGPGASRIAGLWWFMFVVATAVILLITALVVFAIVPARRRRRPKDDPDRTPRWAARVVAIGGVAFPVVILSVLWVLTLRDMNALSQPATPAHLEIEVTGYQWWWKVAYPQQRVVTANDIHIPTGQPVRIVLVTQDVNHSFWVPQLTGKTDLIAGKSNDTWIEADRPGVYRGQCAEYCGLQHANMIFYVVAQEPSAFQAWVAKQQQGAPPATTSELLHGEQVFLSQSCVACHTVRGTSAHGTDGPDLTDFGDRLTIGAGAVPNTTGYLGGWIVDSQGIKPGNKMPPIQLPAQDLQDLIAWLESMR